MNFRETMREKEIERMFKFVEPLDELDLVKSTKQWCQENGMFFVSEEKTV